MLKTTMKLLALTALIFSTGCSDDEKDPGNGKLGELPSKPQNCGPTLQVNLNWGEDPGAFQYLIEIGFQKGGAYETHILDTPKESFPIIMDRGDHYFYTVKRTSNAGQTTVRYADVNIPNCDNWDDFVKANPNYTEPVTLTVQW